MLLRTPLLYAPRTHFTHKPSLHPARVHRCGTKTCPCTFLNKQSSRISISHASWPRLIPKILGKMDTRNSRATASLAETCNAVVSKASAKIPTRPLHPSADNELSKAGSEVAKSLNKRLSSASSSRVSFSHCITGGAIIKA